MKANGRYTEWNLVYDIIYRACKRLAGFRVTEKCSKDLAGRVAPMTKIAIERERVMLSAFVACYYAAGALDSGSFTPEYFRRALRGELAEEILGQDVTKMVYDIAVIRNEAETRRLVNVGMIASGVWGGFKCEQYSEESEARFHLECIAQNPEQWRKAGRVTKETFEAVKNQHTRHLSL